MQADIVSLCGRSSEHTDLEQRLRQLVDGGARGADEFIEGVEWSLARRATIGTQITTDDPPVWFLPIVSAARVTPVVVYYTFDKGHVYLIWIDLADQTEKVGAVYKVVDA